MSDRKSEILAEITATVTKMAELALEAKALGLTDDDMENALEPVFKKFEELFSG